MQFDFKSISMGMSRPGAFRFRSPPIWWQRWLPPLKSAICQRLSRIETFYSRLRRVLGRVGLTPLVSGSAAGSSIMTIPLTTPLNSQKIGDRLKNAGFWVSYESRYLLEHNWIQLCLMSDVPNSRIRDFAIALESILAES